MSEQRYSSAKDRFTVHIPIFQKYLAPLAGSRCRLLEIGDCEGCSTTWLVENILTDPKARLDVIDLRLTDKLRRNVEITGRARQVTLHEGLSRNILRSLPFGDYDFIYIDGSHSTIDVLEDAVLTFRLAKPGGIVAFDEYLWDTAPANQLGTPKPAIDAFLSIYGHPSPHEPLIQVLLMDRQVWVKKLTDHVEPRRHLPDAVAIGSMPHKSPDGPSRSRLEGFLRFVIANDVSAKELAKIMPAFTGRAGSELETIDTFQPPSPAVNSMAMPKEHAEDEVRKLTIGMATYDDYDGVYFTIQAIRLHHPEILNDVDFVIVDNNPDGPCGAALKELGDWISNYRYIAKGGISGTAIRDCVFREARSKFVLCLDCHVLVATGALRQLIDYFEANPETRDLLQGPLIYDDLNNYSTHFEPQWRDGMYGIWGTDLRGADPGEPPFEIPMQGLGLFACRRSIWPGFNPAFRGFGGEEGYIHEKFRQRGGKTLCLPFLRWLHRFNRPLGTRYPAHWEDRVRNYLIGFRELGWDTAPVIAHFKAHLGEPLWSLVVSRLSEGTASPGEHITPQRAPQPSAP